MQIRTIRKGFKHSNANSNLSKGVRNIRMQIRNKRNGFETFESKFKPFEKHAKHSNANSNHSKGVSKHSNANSNHSKGVRNILIQIRLIRKGFEAIKCKFEPLGKGSKYSKTNSNYLKGIRSIRMQIRTIRNVFETFESKFEPFERI